MEKTNSTTTNVKAPLIIRGHHLVHIDKVIQKGVAYKANDFAEQLEYDFLIGDKEYARDVAGTLEKLPSFKEKAAKVYQSFVNAPDDFPIQLVSGLPDGLCAICVIGAHCSNKTNKYWDDKFLDAFIDEAERRGITIEVVEDEHLFSGWPTPLKVRIIKTTKKDVEIVLEKMEVY